MSKSLLARTRLEFYAKFIESARAGGAPEKGIQEAVADGIAQAQSLLAGKCPKCGAPSTRYVDHEHQQGPSEMPGAWVMYRCSTAPPPGKPRGDACDFMIDLIEGEAAN